MSKYAIIRTIRTGATREPKSRSPRLLPSRGGCKSKAGSLLTGILTPRTTGIVGSLMYTNFLTVFGNRHQNDYKMKRIGAEVQRIGSVQRMFWLR